MKDNTIGIKELDVYISKRVGELTNGSQKPTTYYPDGAQNFPIWLVD